MVKATVKDGRFEVVGEIFDRTADGRYVWIETENDDYICLAETVEVIEEVKTTEKKSQIVDKLLGIRKSLKELATESRDCNSIYYTYISEYFRGKGNDQNTRVWLMRKSKQELNKIYSNLNNIVTK